MCFWPTQQMIGTCFDCQYVCRLQTFYGPPNGRPLHRFSVGRPACKKDMFSSANLGTTCVGGLCSCLAMTRVAGLCGRSMGCVSVSRNQISPASFKKSQCRCTCTPKVQAYTCNVQIDLVLCVTVGLVIAQMGV